MKLNACLYLTLIHIALLACSSGSTGKVAEDTTKKSITLKKEEKSPLFRKWKLNVTETMQEYREKFPDVPESQFESVQADYQRLQSTYEFLEDGTCQSTEGYDKFEYTWTRSQDGKSLKMSHDAIGIRDWVIVELTPQKFIVKPNGEADAAIVLE